MDHPSSLSCELSIIRVKNMDMIKSTGQLFVRCYLSSGKNRSIRLDTRQISSNSTNLTWNQTFSLDCSSSHDSIKTLKQGSVIFELRWRSAAPLIGRINGSKVLGKAEIPWKTVMESKGMELEKWVVMVPQNGRALGDYKPPSVQVAMRINQESGDQVVRRKRFNERLMWEECGCMNGAGCNSCCVDYEFFAIEAALESDF